MQQELALALNLSPEELAHPDAAACTYESVGAFKQYLASRLSGAGGVAADVVDASLPSLALLLEGAVSSSLNSNNRAGLVAPVIVKSVDAMGPPAREVLDRLRAIVAGPDNSFRLLERILPLAPAPRFIGARMVVGTHIPYQRHLTLLDAGAKNTARVLFYFGVPAGILHFSRCGPARSISRRRHSWCSGMAAHWFSMASCCSAPCTACSITGDGL